MNPKIKRGPKINTYKIELIRRLRKEGKSITAIGKVIGLTRQGVWRYIKKYNLDK